MAAEERELQNEANARGRFAWVSPSKVRQIAELIRGLPLDEARRIIAFSPKEAAHLVGKVLESAVANADHNANIPEVELVVRNVWADEGPTFKRMRPRARRAAFLIRKRTSHINVVVGRPLAIGTSNSREGAGDGS